MPPFLSEYFYPQYPHLPEVICLDSQILKNGFAVLDIEIDSPCNFINEGSIEDLSNIDRSVIDVFGDGQIVSIGEIKLPCQGQLLMFKVASALTPFSSSGLLGIPGLIQLGIV